MFKINYSKVWKMNPGDAVQNETKKRINYLLKHYMYVFDANLGTQNARLIKGEGLIHKCFLHCVSSMCLYQGVTLPWDPGKKYPDVGSLCVVARAALESLLAFGYIFYLPTDEAEYQFRYKCWKITGLLDRQNLKPKWPLQPEHAKKLEDEEKSIEILRGEILSCKALGAKQQEWLFEKRNWREKGNGWEKIGVDLGFDKSVIKTMYGFLCSHAHSGGLSGIQINHALIHPEEEQPTGLVEAVIPTVLSNMIVLFTKMSEASRKEHESNATAVGYISDFMKFTRGEVNAGRDQANTNE